MSKKKKTDSKWITKVPPGARGDTLCNADGTEVSYEQVGANLVCANFIYELLEHVDGKVVASPFVISIPELVDDDFLHFNVESLQAVTVECLIKLFDTNRIVVHSEE